MAKGLPRVSKDGFDLKKGLGQVLLLHGYTGTPYDLRFVADYLYDHRFRVVAPLLLGHGRNPKDLFAIAANDWIKQAKNAFATLDKTRPTIVGGLSMGALLATILTATLPDVRALVLFSPAFKMTMSFELMKISSAAGFLSQKASFTKVSGGSDVMDPTAKKKSPCYKEMPVKGLLEFDKLRTMAALLLPKIRCPVFIAFGRFDEAIDAYASHRLLMDKLKSPVFSKFYDCSKHVITLDYDRDALCQDLLAFLNNHLRI